MIWSVSTSARSRWLMLPEMVSIACKSCLLSRAFPARRPLAALRGPRAAEDGGLGPFEVKLHLPEARLREPAQLVGGGVGLVVVVFQIDLLRAASAALLALRAQRFRPHLLVE